MTIEQTNVYKFDRDELQYSWLAGLLHDWLKALAETQGPFDTQTFGNEAAFKDVVNTAAAGFAEYAADDCTLDGPSRTATEGLELFHDFFQSLWRG